MRDINFGEKCGGCGAVLARVVLRSLGLRDVQGQQSLLQMEANQVQPVVVHIRVNKGERLDASRRSKVDVVTGDVQQRVSEALGEPRIPLVCRVARSGWRAP